MSRGAASPQFVSWPGSLVTLRPLNPREIAAVFWIVALLVWALWNPLARKALIGLASSVIRWKVMVPLFGMAAYTTAVVWRLAEWGLWVPLDILDTLIWFVLSAIAMIFSALDGAKQARFWRGAVVEQLKVLTIVEYVNATSSFSLPVELILLPAIISLVVMHTIATARDELKVVATPLAIALGLIMLVVVADGLGAGAARVAVDGMPSVLRELALGPLLTVLLLPYLYFYMLIIVYDELRWRIGFNNPAGSRFARKGASRIMLTLRLRLHDIHAYLQANAVVLLGIPSDTAITLSLDAWKSRAQTGPA